MRGPFQQQLRDGDPFSSLIRILEAPIGAPGTVKKACAAVDQCLVLNKDDLRGFFDRCFRILLQRVFGYDDFEASFLTAVTKPGREEDARALVALLCPSGRLFAAMASADGDRLMQYTFPTERLPAHTQELLKTPAGRAELERWPQYRRAIHVDSMGRPQVLLDITSYYMLWNAFYVLRGGSRGSEARRPDHRPAPGVSFMHVPPSIYKLSSSLIGSAPYPGATALRGHPYYQLLNRYLEYCIPRTSSPSPSAPTTNTSTGFSAAGLQPAVSAALQPPYGGFGYNNYSSSYMQATTGQVGNDLQLQPCSLGDVVLSILVEFWLTDLAEPIPVVSTVSLTSPADRSLPNSAMSTPMAGQLGGGSGYAGTSPGGVGAVGVNAASLAAVAAGLGGAPNVTVTMAAPLRLLAYQPPPEELTEALDQLLRYATILQDKKDAPPRPAQTPAPSISAAATASNPMLSSAQLSTSPASSTPVLTSWLPETPIKTPPVVGFLKMTALLPPGLGPAGSPAVQALLRKVYRLLRRGFVQWPLASGTSLTPLIKLWLTILTPWASNLPRALPNSGPTHGSHGGSSSMSGSSGGRHGGGYGSSQGHGGSGRQEDGRNSMPGRYGPEWRPHVLAHLPFYTILVPAFVELCYSRMAFKAEPAILDLLHLLKPLADSPALLDDLRGVETAYNRYVSSPTRRPEGELSDLLPWLAEQASDFETAAAAGAPTQPSMSADPSYRMFSIEPHHSAAYHMCAVLRSAEVQVSNNVVTAVREAALAVLPLRDVANEVPNPMQALQPLDDTSAYPKAGRWQAVHYRGDWLLRPITSREIGFMVRPLVRASLYINAWLGLDKTLSAEEEAEPPEHVLADLMRWLRRKHFRIDLRFLAEKQTLAWIIVLFLAFPIMVRLVCSLFAACGSLATAAGSPAVQLSASAVRGSHGVRR